MQGRENSNQNKNDGVKHLAEAIQSGNAPPGLHIHLSLNRIGPERARSDSGKPTAKSAMVFGGRENVTAPERAYESQRDPANTPS